MNSAILIRRIMIGKSFGFLVGLLAFFLIPYFLADLNRLIPWGVLLWYTTFGAIIGVFGAVTHHPILNSEIPWWLRGPLVGAWMNFVLVFFAYDVMQSMIHVIFDSGMISSPFWFALEGAIIGFTIDFLATHYGGKLQSSES